MVEPKAAKDCGFDVLFGKSVPHIIDKIFLKLDFDSFMACREVSTAWNTLLSSGAYRNRPMELLRERLNKEKKKKREYFETNIIPQLLQDKDVMRQRKMFGNILIEIDAVGRGAGMWWVGVVEAIEEHNKQKPHLKIMLSSPSKGE